MQCLITLSTLNKILLSRACFRVQNTQMQKVSFSSSFFVFRLMLVMNSYIFSAASLIISALGSLAILINQNRPAYSSSIFSFVKYLDLKFRRFYFILFIMKPQYSLEAFLSGSFKSFSIITLTSSDEEQIEDKVERVEKARVLMNLELCPVRCIRASRTNYEGLPFYSTP